MAPFRRGKSNSSTFREASSRGRNSHRGGYRGIPGAKTALKDAFQASRVEELAENRSGISDIASDADDPGIGSEELLDHDDTSESDAAPEKPYSVLLQTLKPRLPTSEPGKRRRKIDSGVITPKPNEEHISGDLDTVEDAEVAGESLDEDSVHGSDVENSPQEPDFFTQHFAERDDDETLREIRSVEKNRWEAEKPNLGPSWSSTVRRPLASGEARVDLDRGALKAQTLKVSLKPKLESFAEQLLSNADDLITRLIASVSSYQDVLFSARSLDNADTLRRLIGLHILNHIFRTRDRVLKNSAKLSKIGTDEDLELRDQGFTRPKVLVLLPTRQSCVKMIDAIIAMCKPEQQVNRQRFQDSYASVEEELSADKPEDFKDLFGGNDDDMFRLGLKFTRKTIKFFSQFYNSDIIFASPLGLRTSLGGDEGKKADCDFLSSIEVVVMDQSEALLMQNWEHVGYIFEHLNLQPKEAHGCDFSRVRSWYLDGHAKYLRQTILFSAFNFPALNKLYTRHMPNVAGKAKFARNHDGAIVDVGLPVKQTFSRFDFTDPTSEPDDRFNYFSTTVLPSLIKISSLTVGGQQGTLVFMPLYADFVRVRNHLAASSSTQHVSFGSISEYTPVKDVTRARSHFVTGRHSMLLYTERAHHFRRYRLKGVKRVIFYGLPENPLFYREIVSDYLGSYSLDPNAGQRQYASVRCLFSKLDLLKLERIVGTKRYLSLLSEKGDTFDFV
ncbi:MAG: hypothetical protein Q9166_005066 [cf. Caloplaca sp. 2 TL-2023]